MTDDSAPIRWRLHLRSSPSDVFRLLDEDAGRARFWAEASRRRGDDIEFVFPDGTSSTGRVIRTDPPRRLELRYFGAHTTFDLAEDAGGGTDLTLTASGVPADERCEVMAGWVSVLMALKAAADHGIDLRNHDRTRTWADRYADN